MNIATRYQRQAAQAIADRAPSWTPDRLVQEASACDQAADALHALGNDLRSQAAAIESGEPMAHHGDDQ